MLLSTPPRFPFKALPDLTAHVPQPVILLHLLKPGARRTNEGSFYFHSRVFFFFFVKSNVETLAFKPISVVNLCILLQIAG